MKIPSDRQHEERAARLKRFATPYSLKESVGILRRNFKGVNLERNRGIVDPSPRETILHPGDQTVLTVGFIGDIMNIDDKALGYGEQLMEWASSCDLMVGNFEATIHDRKERDGVKWGANQPQAERIVEDLAEFFDPAKFHLGLANNHSGDYTRSVFERSCAMLRSAGFPLFGMADSPSADIAPELRIVGGTMWSNQNADDMLWLHKPREAGQYKRNGALNILYPHWGHELEAWPRPFIVRQAHEFADQYDAVIGHHAHNPQPLEMRGGVPIFYGLGDFCFYYNLPTYRYGTICRLEIGRPSPDAPARIRSVAWEPIENRHADKQITVDIAANPRRWLVA